MTFNNKKGYIKRLIPRQIVILIINLKIVILRIFRKNFFGLENFPFDMYARPAFYRYPFFRDPNTKSEYYAQYYREGLITGNIFDITSYSKYKAEILEGSYYTKDEFNFNIDQASLLPISLPNNKTDLGIGSLSIDINGKKLILEGLKYNSFHYLPIKERSTLKIRSKQSLIIGDLIKINQQVKNTKKLVVTIFVDGLSSKIINQNTIQSLMPNTNLFFEHGARFYDCFSSSEWTLPSVASISSGLFPSKHDVVNPRGKIEVGKKYKLLAEYFKESEYLTAKFCSNERKNPFYGYMKGFDRTIYKMHMDCYEIVTNAIEHLNTFKQRDNYLWLSFFDLHHHLYQIPDISSQKNIPLHFHTYKKNILNSPFLSYDEKLINWYQNETKRLDLCLQILYSYISQNYNMNDVVVSLVSDHGQAYVGKQKDLLSEQKLTTLLFFVGGEVPKTTANEIVQNVDYLPSILKLSGISADEKFDGKLPHVLGGDSERGFSFSESIYPNRKYEVAIYDEKFMFYLISHEIWDNLLNLDNRDCEFKLVNRMNGENETLINDEICDFYFEYINNHLKNVRKNGR